MATILIQISMLFFLLIYISSSAVWITKINTLFQKHSFLLHFPYQLGNSALLWLETHLGRVPYIPSIIAHGIVYGCLIYFDLFPFSCVFLSIANLISQFSSIIDNYWQSIVRHHGYDGPDELLSSRRMSSTFNQVDFNYMYSLFHLAQYTVHEFKY